jgi:hypothetical protein
MFDTEKPFHCATRWEGFFFVSKAETHNTSDARAAVAPGTENPQVRKGLTVQRSPSIARKAVGGIFLLISSPSEGAARRVMRGRRYVPDVTPEALCDAQIAYLDVEANRSMQSAWRNISKP